MFCFVTVGLLVILAVGWRNAPLIQNRLFRAGLFASFPVGILVGVLSSFLVKYQVSPTQRIIGFPLPAAVLLLEGGRWVDYVGPIWMLNPFLVGGGLMLPFSVALLVKRRRLKLASQMQAAGLCGGCGYDLTGNTSGACPERGAAVNK